MNKYILTSILTVIFIVILKFASEFFSWESISRIVIAVLFARVMANEVWSEEK